jgi:N-acetylglucosaminyldiphosphoundecaprenol N-acetyl-beta-D-mannosaminyltransferase
MTGPAAAGSPPPTVELAGLGIASIRMAEVVDHIDAALVRGEGGVVATVNLDILRQVSRDPSLRDFWSSRDLLVADGMPVLWAARVAGVRLPERVAGSDLIKPLCERAAATRRRVVFIGGNPGAAEGAKGVLVREFPGLEIAAALVPPMGFEADSAYMSSLCREVAGLDPDLVLVGLGFPKQERLIARLRAEHPRAWYIGVGITFSFLAGEVRRAPVWMRRTGLEWLHRMIQEPGRLFRRYIIHDIPYFARLLGGIIAARLTGGRRASG